VEKLMKIDLEGETIFKKNQRIKEIQNYKKDYEFFHIE